MAIILVCLFIYGVGDALCKYGRMLESMNEEPRRPIDAEFTVKDENDIPFAMANPKLVERYYGKARGE